MIGSIIEWLVGRLGTSEPEEDMVKIIDPRGHPIVVPREYINSAIHAEMVNAAKAREGELFYEIGWAWYVDVTTLREWFRIAIHYGDPDTAILAVAAHTNWDDMPQPEATED